MKSTRSTPSPPEKTSSTFGGISWLAHGTLHSGLWVDSHLPDYIAGGGDLTELGSEQLPEGGGRVTELMAELEQAQRAGNWEAAQRLYRDAIAPDRHPGGPQQKV